MAGDWIRVIAIGSHLIARDGSDRLNAVVTPNMGNTMIPLLDGSGITADSVR